MLIKGGIGYVGGLMTNCLQDGFGNMISRTRFRALADVNPPETSQSHFFSELSEQETLVGLKSRSSSWSKELEKCFNSSLLQLHHSHISNPVLLIIAQLKITAFNIVRNHTHGTNHLQHGRDEGILFHP